MHTAALKEKGLPFLYGVIDVTSEYLPSLFTALRGDGFRGVNVTVPHKESVMRFLDDVSAEAKAVGAVNTVVNEHGTLTGHNTDIAGIKESLLPFGEAIGKGNVLILGAGGASRAVGYTVAKHFSPKTVTIHNRTQSRANSLVQMFSKDFPDTRWSSSIDYPSLTRSLEKSALVINATSVGMYPDSEANPVPAGVKFSNDQIIFDIVYNPIETVLLRQARMAGARTVNGIEMFLHQGAEAFELWTQEKFPLETARSVVIKELAGMR